MKQKTTLLKKRCAAAALRLAAKHAWDKLTLEQIAKAVKISTAQIKKLFANTNALLPVIVGHITDEVAQTIGHPLSQGSARDRLFEVMMARFDIHQKNRKAILSIIAAVKRDPSRTHILLSAQVQAMQKMLAQVGLKQDGIKDLIATAGLMAIYGATLHCWERDESNDMSPTMAVLDRHLRRADKLAEILFRTF